MSQFGSYEHYENYDQQMPLTESDVSSALSDVMRRVYGIMSIGLLLTAIVAWFVAGSETLVNMIFSNSAVFFGIIILELGFVMFIARMINKLNPTAAIGLFLFYSAINGITMAAIFLIYTYSSIAGVFAVTAGMFAGMSILGFTTKTDLSKYGAYLFMGLIGVILGALLNFWLQSPILYWVVTYVGLAVFLGLTIYDTQKIKQTTIGALNQSGSNKLQATTMNRIAAGGALRLYLDFVNLFIMLLRIFGKRR